MPAVAKQVFRFGQFELDPDLAELRRGGRPVRLQPQPFKLLLLMVRRADALVTREEIRAELWPDGTYVDFDQAVNFAIRQIRDALGDSADRPLYVQTLPKRGYRFIAPVEDPGRATVQPAVRVAGVDVPPGTTTVRLQKALWANIAELKMAHERQKRIAMTAVIVAVVVVAAVVVVYLVRG